jgi:hypothetical protein
MVRLSRARVTAKAAVRRVQQREKESASSRCAVPLTNSQQLLYYTASIT